MQLILATYTHGGRRWRFSTTLKLPKSGWSKSKSRAKPGYKYSAHINAAIDGIETKIIGIAYDIISRGHVPDVDLVESSYKSMTKPEGDFWELWERFMKTHVSDMAETTIKRYGAIKSNLEQYEAEKGSKLHIRLIDDHVFASLRNLMQQQGNIESTRNRKLRDLRTFIRWVEKNELAKTNKRVENFSIARDQKKRQATLTEDEILQLAYSVLPSQRLTRTRDLFLFHVDTGLRYNEAQVLAPENFTGDILSYINGKGKRKVVIRRRLTKRAIWIAGHYGGSPPKMSNQEYNRVIKEAARLAGLTRNVMDRGSLKMLCDAIHTHTARHTFSTRLLNKGQDIRVISKMMGHSDMKTTSFYDQTDEQEQFKMIDILDS